MAATLGAQSSSSVGLSGHHRSVNHLPSLLGNQHKVLKGGLKIRELQRYEDRIVSTRVARKPLATAVVATATALLSPSTVNVILMVLTSYYLAIFGAMITMGRSFAVRSFIRPLWAFLPLALGYGLLLANSWTADTLSIMMPGSLEEGLKGKVQFIPRLEGIMQLFQKPATAASLIVHLQAINLYLGRNIFLEGQNYSIPTFHSLILACFTGPLGLLSHYATKAIWKGRSDTEGVKLQSDGGTLTLMPYQEVWDYGK